MGRIGAVNTRQCAWRLVAALVLASLVLLATAYVLAQRTATRLEVQKLATQAEVVRQAFTGLLTVAQPLRLFAGFCNVIRPVVKSEPSIAAIYVLDPEYQRVRLCATQAAPEAVDPGPWRPGYAFTEGANRYVVEHGASHLRLLTPLVDKFGQLVGHVAVLAPHERLTAGLTGVFVPAAAALALLLVASGLFLVGMANPEVYRHRRETLVAFLVPFAIALAIVLVALYAVFAERLSGRAKAFAEVIGARLIEVVEMGIDPGELGQLDRMLLDYQRVNPDVGFIALIEGSTIAQCVGGGVATGDRWRHPGDYYGHVVEVRPRQILAPQYRVAVGIPRRVLLGHYWGVLRLLLPVALLGVLAVGLLVRAGTVCLGPTQAGTPAAPAERPRPLRHATAA